MLKKCSCHACRYGLHTKAGGHVAQKAHRKLRRETKLALKRGQEPPKYIGIGYTD